MKKDATEESLETSGHFGICELADPAFEILPEVIVDEYEREITAAFIELP
jgi:hypothetical protein